MRGLAAGGAHGPRVRVGEGRFPSGAAAADPEAPSAQLAHQAAGAGKLVRDGDGALRTPAASRLGNRRVGGTMVEVIILQHRQINLRILTDRRHGRKTEERPFQDCPLARQRRTHGSRSPGSAENEEVLLRQEIVLRGEAQSGGLSGAQHPCLLDLFVKVDQRDPSARTKRAPDPSQIGARLWKMMIGVHGDDQIAAAARQERIVRQSEDRRDVPGAGGGEPLAEDLHQSRIRVGGEDVRGGAREQHGEVPGAGADLTDHRFAPDFEDAQDFAGLLPLVAAGIGEAGDVRVQIFRIPEAAVGVLIAQTGRIS